MTMKGDAKFRERMTCGFKYDMRNLVSFYPTTQKSMGSFRWALFIQSLSFKNTEESPLYFDGLFLSKAHNVSARKFYRNYASWHL